MRAVAQRVSWAAVEVESEVVGEIGQGLLVYFGAGEGDTEQDLIYTTDKLAGLRVFQDDAGKMARSVTDVAGSVLLVPQFTLFGDVRGGLRPSFITAAAPERGLELFEAAATRLRNKSIPVETGRFRANMLVKSHVAGPVTILIDSRKTF